MTMFLILAYLFFIGSIFGWVLELFFRRFISDANPERKWINPGFCVGPYVPLYGFGLCILYLLASYGSIRNMNTLPQRLLLFLGMAVSMTAIEYVAGVLALRFAHIRLWDYSREWGNFQGLICPKFSLFWALGSAGYYFLVHPHILEALHWLSENLAFSFVIGFFFGVFCVDVAYSANIVARMKAFAHEYQVVVRYEFVKATIRRRHDALSQRTNFLFPFHSSVSLPEHLKDAMENWEIRHRDN